MAITSFLKKSLRFIIILLSCSGLYHCTSLRASNDNFLHNHYKFLAWLSAHNSAHKNTPSKQNTLLQDLEECYKQNPLIESSMHQTPPVFFQPTTPQNNPPVVLNQAQSQNSNENNFEETFKKLETLAPLPEPQESDSTPDTASSSNHTTKLTTLREFCTLCNKTILHKSMLVHMKEHLHKFQCPHCTKTMPANPSNFISHLKKSHNYVGLICRDCGALFDNKEAISSHKSSCRFNAQNCTQLQEMLKNCVIPPHIVSSQQ